MRHEQCLSRRLPLGVIHDWKVSGISECDKYSVTVSLQPIYHIYRNAVQLFKIELDPTTFLIQVFLKFRAEFTDLLLYLLVPGPWGGGEAKSVRDVFPVLLFEKTLRFGDNIFLIIKNHVNPLKQCLPRGRFNLEIIENHLILARSNTQLDTCANKLIEADYV